MRKFAYVMSAILFLSGCTQSNEEIKKASIEQTEVAFEGKQQDTNEDAENFSYYLPDNFQVKETNKFNVLLEKGNQSFILFVNQNEEKSSLVSYKTLLNKYEKPFISETFEKGDQSGYLFVVELDDKMYEVTVGVGGTKLTTESSASDLEEDAQVMMEIVKSVQ